METWNHVHAIPDGVAEVENALAEIGVDDFLALIDLGDGEPLTGEDVSDEVDHPGEFAWG